RRVHREFLSKRFFPGLDRENGRSSLPQHADQLSVIGLTVDKNAFDFEGVRLDAGEHALDRVSLAVITVDRFDRQREWLSAGDHERCAVTVTLCRSISGSHSSEFVFVVLWFAMVRVVHEIDTDGSRPR